MKLELHDTPETDKILKRIALVTTVIIGLGLSAGTIRGCMNDIDEGWATHSEVHEIDRASMYQHLEEVEATPYAMKHDINVVLDVMRQEQIDDAQNEIEEIEDKEDLGLATPSDIRKKSRLQKDIVKYKSKLIKKDTQ